MAAVALRLQGGRNHRPPRVQPALALQDHVWDQLRGRRQRRTGVRESVSPCPVYTSEPARAPTGGPGMPSVAPGASRHHPLQRPSPRASDRQTDRETGLPGTRRP